jgi:hypothetical protein
MKKSRNINLPISLMCLILALMLASSFSLAQKESDEALKKKYAPILGEYEFEEIGLILKYYIESGDLWVDSGDGRPAIMQPVEGESLVFKAEDPQTGVFDISFEKDEKGDYTINRVSNDMAGMEVVGYKIK